MGEYLVYVEMSRAIFPGRCGYKSIVGGKNINLSNILLFQNRTLSGVHCYFYKRNITFFIGALKNLRESTTNEKVRQYHQEFYRPENLTIVITGQVKHADVFKALQIIEKKIISKVYIYNCLYFNSSLLS